MWQRGCGADRDDRFERGTDRAEIAHGAFQTIANLFLCEFRSQAGSCHGDAALGLVHGAACFRDLPAIFDYTQVLCELRSMRQFRAVQPVFERSPQADCQNGDRASDTCFWATGDWCCTISRAGHLVLHTTTGRSAVTTCAVACDIV